MNSISHEAALMQNILGNLHITWLVTVRLSRISVGLWSWIYAVTWQYLTDNKQNCSQSLAGQQSAAGLLHLEKLPVSTALISASLLGPSVELSSQQLLLDTKEKFLDHLVRVGDLSMRCGLKSWPFLRLAAKVVKLVLIWEWSWDLTWKTQDLMLLT